MDPLSESERTYGTEDSLRGSGILIRTEPVEVSSEQATGIIRTLQDWDVLVRSGEPKPLLPRWIL